MIDSCLAERTARNNKLSFFLPVPKKPFFLLLLLVPLTLYSQGVRFSFNINPQYSWFSSNNEDVVSDGGIMGFNPGIEMDVFFMERYAFSTGITLNHNGGRLVYQDSLRLEINDEKRLLVPGNQLKYSFQYLTLPLGLKFKTVEIGYTTFWINVGLTPMVLLRSRGTDENDDFRKADLMDESKRVNLDYFLEGGMEYSLGGTTAITAGIGYHSGFTDVTSNSADRIHTRSLSLVLGLLF